jgi:subtilisin family serine protease
MYLSDYTGNGIRIGVIDSGVHADHPHVRGVEGGVGIREDGSLVDDFVDRLGHGTAVAAAIREKAPDADIVAIKVFWRSLATDITTLVRAIDEAAARGAVVINLSLGTSEMAHRERLADAVARARAHGALVVAAHDDGGVRWLPGCLEDVVAVRADWSCAREAYGVEFVEDRLVLTTSPYPRDIPGVSRDRNVHGISFAVANASAFVARALEAMPRAERSNVARVLATLEEDASVQRTPA